jgi:glucosamine--fructose-6-phosphate aminotransferase (isomerizing)
MCGIFGFVAKTPTSTLSMKLLKRMAVDTERRGPHSYGFAWIDSRNRLKMYKHVGRISKNLDALDVAADAKMLIGHCRYATHGEIDNLNAHPHPCDGGWIIHNGVISHHRQINEEFGLNPVTECDSETVGMLIEQLDGSLVDRVSETIRQLALSNFAMMGIWKSSSNRMVVARAGNPLHFTTRSSGVYLASYKTTLGDNAKSVKNGSLKMFSHRSGGLVVQSKQAIETEPPMSSEEIESLISRRHQPEKKQPGIWKDRFGDSFQRYN